MKKLLPDNCLQCHRPPGCQGAFAA